MPAYAGATDVGATDAGATDVGAAEVGAAEVGAADVRATDAGATPLPPAYPSSRTPSVARFVERAADVGTTVRLIAAADLPSAVVDIVSYGDGRHPGERPLAVVWTDPLLDAAVEAMRRGGIQVLPADGDTDDACASAAFGLTTVNYAIAETGTLVLATGLGRSRGASLLPSHHIAVLPEERIYADLFALVSVLRPPLPSALTFITGPSRTADIGLTPVRPAHGPMDVTVLVVAAPPTQTGEKAP